MSEKNRVLVIAAAVVAMLFIAGGSLYASPFLFESPQKSATATQFWSDADLFLSVKGYKAVDFEKFFGAISFSNSDFSNQQTRMAQLGFAAQFGDLYTALYYGGNGLNIPLHTYTEDTNGKRTYTEDSSLYLPKTGNRALVPYNELSLLFGVADMGIRLSFATDYRSRELTDFSVGTADLIDYKNFHDEHGSLNPQIAWGMAKPLLESGLQPHVYIDLDFHRNSSKSDTGDGIVIGRSSTNAALNYNYTSNHFGLGVVAAAGGLSLYENNGFDFGFDLWYILNLMAFDNEYTNDPGTIVAFNGKRNNDGSFDTNFNSHTLIPYLYAAWEDDKLALSAELGLGLGLINSTTSDLDLSGSSAVKQGEESVSTIFEFNPTLDLGLKWAIVPEKFFLNVGTSISFFTLSLASTTIDEYTNDTKGNDTVTAIENEFGHAETKLMLGFTFNPTKNIGLQAMAGVTANNSVSVFDTTNGLAVFSKIMATVKF